MYGEAGLDREPPLAPAAGEWLLAAVHALVQDEGSAALASLAAQLAQEAVGVRVLVAGQTAQRLVLPAELIAAELKAKGNQHARQHNDEQHNTETSDGQSACL
jgi:hypothetical protein